jgi:hypothetical protein
VPTPGSVRVSDADIGTVGALCELQLAARRLGCTIRIVDASADLLRLIAFAGLEEVLLGLSAVESGDTEAADIDGRVDLPDPDR